MKSNEILTTNGYLSATLLVLKHNIFHLYFVLSSVKSEMRDLFDSFSELREMCKEGS